MSTKEDDRPEESLLDRPVEGTQTYPNTSSNEDDRPGESSLLDRPELASADTLQPKNNRSVNDYELSDKTGPNFVDHFSLRHPSSTVRFRGARVHVYDSTNEQILLEDRRSHFDTDGNDHDQDDDDIDNSKSRPRQHRHTITVKRMELAGFGLRMLRLIYTLIAILLAGFAFVLCFQIILFLFFNLPVEAGKTSVEPTAGQEAEAGDPGYLGVIIGIILSIPVFLYAMSSYMAIVTTFVGDCWSGGSLVRAVFGLDAIVTEILYFVFFLLVPLVTFMGALFAGAVNPWEITCYVWVPTVAILESAFALAIVWREVVACFQLISIHWGNESSIFKQIGRAILLTRTQFYSGYKNEDFLVAGDDIAPEGGYSTSDNHDPLHMNKSLYTRLTQMSCLNFMYDTVDPPKRLWTIGEVRDLMPFMTRHSWSLEAMFCVSDRDRRILSAKGPSALTRTQVISSVACNVVGTLLILIGIISALVWLQTGVLVISVVAVLCILCCLLPMMKSNYVSFNLFKQINEDDADIDDDFENEIAEASSSEKDEEEDVKEKAKEVSMFRVLETSRVTNPKPWVCYTGAVLEVLFLFLWPLITLYATGNIPVGAVFTIVGVFSFIRRWFNASVILSELGSMSDISIEKSTDGKRFLSGIRSSLKGGDRTLVAKSRLAEIIGQISQSPSVGRWMWCFGIFLVLVFGLFLSAVNSDDGLGERPPIVLTDQYYWPGEDSLQYPTCTLSKGFRVGGIDGQEHSSALLDYAFSSALAYEVPNVTSYLLPKWFGDGVAIDEDEFVTQYRIDSGTTTTPTYFKLFTFPDMPDTALVAIRGSQTMWDWCVNMQLWSAAGLAQVVKWMTPYGWIWSSVLDELVTSVNFIQSASIQKVSYYTVISGFVEDMLSGYNNTGIEKLFVTGASLGGGLAIITGAQTGAPAVAISGLGAELSRHTLSPPVSIADINEHVFNWIPDRDYIARIGGRPRQHQEAQCSAHPSNLFGCHSMWRSVCEIAFRCGTAIDGAPYRPIPCRCVYRFGYDAPIPVGNTTKSFAEICQEEEDAFLAATGSTKTSGIDYSSYEYE